MSNGIVQFFARLEEIKDSTLDRTASPTSKGLPVNSSHSHLVTRSCRHPVNLSPVNLSPCVLSHSQLVTSEHITKPPLVNFLYAHRSDSTQIKQCSTWGWLKYARTPGQTPGQFGSAVRRRDSLRDTFVMPGQFGSAIRRMQGEMPGQVISDN